MGQALYRTYRSKKLSEIVGQEHITTALERALKNGTISHAYLFTGPRGTGKTSIARILAHEINGLAYEDGATNLDIIEIDAASNRRIDEIRDLRDKVHVAPTSAKYKVYIIDEVHMLTREAFNALLKTLEEPPAHAVFILATTEAHKLPETIISRTQRYAFKPVELNKVADHLKHIAKEEKIEIEPEAVALIAAHGEGSFRDSISLLDQVRNSGDKITLAGVQASLGIAPKATVEELLEAVSTHDAPAVIQKLTVAKDAGHEPAQMAKQLGQALRTQLTGGTAKLANDLLLALLAKLIEVPASNDPKSQLEIALLDIALAGQPLSEAEKPKSPKVMQEEVQAKTPVQIEPHPSTLRKKMAEAEAVEAEMAAADAPTETAPTDEKSAENSGVASDALLDTPAWQNVLAAIKNKHNTLYGIVRTTTPHFEAGKITLECAYAFHQKKLNEKTSKNRLADTVKEVTGQDIQIACIVGGAKPNIISPLPPMGDEQVHTVNAAPVAPPIQNETVTKISNIFGGAELLES